MIVADDLGFSDIGAFGGEIHQPMINLLSYVPNKIHLPPAVLIPEVYFAVCLGMYPLVVGASALSSVGQPDVMQALSQNVPSFNAQSYGADAAALTLSAALRGLNPDDKAASWN